MQFRVVVVSCLDSGLLLKARLTNAELMRVESTITNGLHPNAKGHPALHWTHLLIDEVSSSGGLDPQGILTC